MKTQMELGLNGQNRIAARRGRVPGARWWFQQMHLVVDKAFDWSSPEPRPEQIYLTLPGNRLASK